VRTLANSATESRASATSLHLLSTENG
jgi:hypothetical protein